MPRSAGQGSTVRSSSSLMVMPGREVASTRVRGQAWTSCRASSSSWLASPGETPSRLSITTRQGRAGSRPMLAATAASRPAGTRRASSQTGISISASPWAADSPSSHHRDARSLLPAPMGATSTRTWLSGTSTTGSSCSAIQPRTASCRSAGTASSRVLRRANDCRTARSRASSRLRDLGENGTTAATAATTSSSPNDRRITFSASASVSSGCDFAARSCVATWTRFHSAASPPGSAQECRQSPRRPRGKARSGCRSLGFLPRSSPGSTEGRFPGEHECGRPGC